MMRLPVPADSRDLVSRAPRAQLVVVLTAVLLTGCFGGSSTPAPKNDAPTHPLQPAVTEVGKPLATVQGRPVGTTAFESVRGSSTPAIGSVFTPEEKRAFLDEAIEDELLFQEAFRRGLYNEKGIRRAMIAALVREEVYEDLELPEHSEEAMRAWFLDHRDQFSIEERVHLQRIFLVPGASRDADATKALAEQLRAEALKDPERFPELARQHSDGALALRSGDAGFLTPAGRPEVPHELVMKAFQMDVGSISEPVEMAGGWNLIRVVDRRARIDRTFEQVRAAVKRRMNQEVIAERQAAFVKGLRDASSVQIDDAALDAYTPKLTRRPGLDELPAVAERQFEAPEGMEEPVDPRREMVEQIKKGGE